MKKIAAVFILVAMFIATSNAIAGPKFPEKGWHKGPYLFVMGGMTQAGNDRNVDTNMRFASIFAPAVGLTFGWDIADWIGPMLSLKYGFDTDTVGNNTPNHPVQNAREHIINIELMGRVTFLTGWKNISEKFKILPYVKVGGAAHGLYINAAASANKGGSWGYGPGVGAGIEGLIIDKIWVGIDLQENLLFLQSVKKTVGGTPNTEILKGGFYPQFALMGTVGYHF